METNFIFRSRIIVAHVDMLFQIDLLSKVAQYDPLSFV